MIGRLSAVAGAVLVAVSVAYVTWLWWSRTEPPPDGPLVEGWAAGVETFVMDLPEGCSAQRLEYRVTRAAHWLNFARTDALAGLIALRADSATRTR